jgi:hypothetical protein
LEKLRRQTKNCRRNQLNELNQRCRSNGQTMTTFGAPGTDDGATATGRHADEEAVRALATNHRRLISAFHG